MTTIVAAATPPGRAALGVVRASGPACRALASRLLGWEDPEPRRASTRRFVRGGRLVDRVVAAFWAAPDTPTGEDLLEITAHGSPEILAEVVEAFLEAGAVPAAPGEFTRRAFSNGRLDLAQARAVGDLIAARGTAARRAALARLEGGAAAALAEARAPVQDLLARLEASLDHPEEDLAPVSDPEFDAALARAEAAVERLLAGWRRGRPRRAGARVGLFGAPNAGKSSLLNALLGRPRAIVSPEPGTTRDTIEEEAELSGRRVVLVDTAGLREDARDGAEREGVARAEAALAACAVAVVVDDAREESRRARARLEDLAAREGVPVVRAWSKADLEGGRARPADGVACSALTGAGLDALARAVADAAGPQDEGESLLDDAAQARSVEEARDALRAARALAAGPARDELAAARLREALEALGRAEGRDAAAETLDAVFSRFCVGK